MRVFLLYKFTKPSGKKPGNRMIYGLLPADDWYVIVLPAQFSNYFLEDLRKLADLANSPL